MEDVETLHTQTRNLDYEQMAVIDLIVDYCKQYRRALGNPEEMNSTLPKPFHLVVIGSAGTGKSHVIHLGSGWTEFLLKKEGDNINHPYCIRVALTGTAASNISGQTLHSSFRFEFGNSFTSLKDKARDTFRILLRLLRIGRNLTNMNSYFYLFCCSNC